MTTSTLHKNNHPIAGVHRIWSSWFIAMITNASAALFFSYHAIYGSSCKILYCNAPHSAGFICVLTVMSSWRGVTVLNNTYWHNTMTSPTSNTGYSWGSLLIRRYVTVTVLCLMSGHIIRGVVLDLAGTLHLHHLPDAILFNNGVMAGNLSRTETISYYLFSRVLDRVDGNNSVYWF